MEQWAELKKQLDEVEKEIKEEVISLGKSQTHGEVHAKFTKGKDKVDYQAAVQNVPDSKEKTASVVEHSSTKVTIKWKSVAEDLNVSEETLKNLTTTGDPKVDVKLVPQE